MSRERDKRDRSVHNGLINALRRKESGGQKLQYTQKNAEDSQNKYKI